MHVRHDWIKASKFHALDEVQVFNEIYRRIRELRDSVVLLDLDSTLYEVSPRTYQILKEWAHEPSSLEFGAITTRVKKATLDEMGYSLRDTFATLGLDLHDSEVHRAWENAKHFWNHRFFSNHYLKYDNPYPGAIDFVRKVQDLGAKIVYLTGRDEPRMGQGTRNKLIEDGFPWDPSEKKIQLILKEAAPIDDRKHKEEAGQRIAKMGTLVTSFENEPANLIALQAVFPKAMHVFVETAFSDHPAPAGKDLYRIKSFQP